MKRIVSFIVVLIMSLSLLSGASSVFALEIINSLGELADALDSDDQTTVSTQDYTGTFDNTSRLCLDVSLEKNAIFAKYDVEVFLNNVFLGTVEHGGEMVFYVALSDGQYNLTFCKEDSSIIKGDTTLTVAGDTTYECTLVNHELEVEVKKEKTTNGINVPEGTQFTDLTGAAPVAATPADETPVEELPSVATEEVAQPAADSYPDFEEINLEDPSVIMAIQTALNGAGFDCGTPDGSAGPGTQNAIRGYENARSLEETGQVTRNIAEFLGLVFSKEYAKRAALTAMTNYFAANIMTDDGTGYDEAKFHTFYNTKDEIGNDYIDVVAWGTWNKVDDTTWHVDGLEFKNDANGLDKIVSLDVRRNGENYEVANIVDSSSDTFEEGRPTLIVKPYMIANGRDADVGNASASAETPELIMMEPATEHKETMGERNALRSAKGYLSFMSFSYSGLIGQLEFEGYTTEEATYAADNCGADWNEQAALKAESYLEFMAFSRDGLIEQLEYEGFTYDQAVYGVTAVGY